MSTPFSTVSSVPGVHGGDVDQLEVLLTAQLGRHVPELLCDPDQTQIQIEFCRESHDPVSENVTELSIYMSSIKKQQS